MHLKFIVATTLMVLTGFFFINFIIPVIFVTNNIEGVISVVVTPSFGLVLLMMSIYTLQFVFAGLALSVRFKLLNQHLD